MLDELTARTNTAAEFDLVSDLLTASYPVLMPATASGVPRSPKVEPHAILLPMLNTLKSWAHVIRRDVTALYLAGRDARTPWIAKAVAVLVVGYALSPIDLIPDFIPVIGYLDDLIIVPLGILLAIHLIPTALMVEFRRSAEAQGNLPASRAAAAIVISLWVVAVIACAAWVLPWFQH